MLDLGDFTTSDTLYVPIATYDSNGASVTLTGLAVTDIEIYKDGSVTQRASDNGYALLDTDGIDFDGVVGLHGYSVDLSDNSDAAFYANGSKYWVVINAVTIDGQTVVIVHYFTIGRYLKPTVAGRTLDVTAAGEAGLDFDNTVGTIAAAQLAADCITAAKVAPDVHAETADALLDEAMEEHDTKGKVGWAFLLMAYSGSDGPGIYIDSGAANTNTVLGTDGTEAIPVSTIAAARTLADALGVKIYYLEGNSDITIDATHEDWEFIGIGSVEDNVINLGSQNVDRSLFRNLTIEGTQGGTGRITARDCALRDPGAGVTTLHIFAERCGIVDEIEVDTSADNVFDGCFSLAASGVPPIIIATGAAGSILISHYGGRIELRALSASHNIELDGHGHVTFNADCNVNANLDIHGIWDVEDNTVGMSDLATMAGIVNMTKINAEADTAISDASLALASVCTEARLSELDEATAGKVANQIDLIKTEADKIALVDAGAGVAGSVIEEVENRALASVCTEARLAELDAGNLPGDMDTVVLAVADLYHADIQLTIDGANTRDEYTVRWFKNGQRVTSGITVPTIQVVNRADGTDLVASTAMTQIGTTGSYRYDEATNRITNGEAVEMIAGATIDGAPRSFSKIGARDSVAA